MRRLFLTLLAVGALRTTAALGDDLRDAVDAVMDAFEAKDDKALQALAAKNPPGPWLVADRLCYHGEYDAAEAFAKAALGKDTERLPAYVASRRGTPPNTAAWEAAFAAKKALAAKDPKAALAAIEAVNLKAADVVSVILLYDRGITLRHLRRLEDSAKAFLAAAEAAKRLGWVRHAAAAFLQSGHSAANRSDWRGALHAWERSLALHESLGIRSGVADALNNIGVIHRSLGDYAKALDYYGRALTMMEELGDRAPVAGTLNNIGNVHRDLGDNAKALEYYERALEKTKELKDRAGVASALNSIGIVHENLGDYARALEYCERALKMRKELKDRGGVAASLESIGIIHSELGDYPKSLRYCERSLKLKQELGDRAGVATTFMNIGNSHAGLGDNAKALDYYGRALKMMEELGDRAGVARSLNNIGNIHLRLGDYPKALEYYERALKQQEKLGNRAEVAATFMNTGIIHSELGDYPKSLRYFERAQALAAELGALATEVGSLWGLSATQFRLGKPAEAARAARRGVAKLPLLVGGLAEEQGPTARDRWAGLLENGVGAGMLLEDAAEVLFFLESGRAGALLESLGGRKALGDAAIPQELQREERTARAAVLEAQAHLAQAHKARKRREIREARADLEAARKKLLEAVAKIQRVAKAAADVQYPKAADLKKIQAAVAPEGALVSYAILEDETVALVVTRERARIVRIAKLGETSLALADPKKSWKEAVARLRKAVVEPLGLGKKTKRLLVSPAGALSYVPFGVLAPDREVVYVPSGTTYTVLLDERDKRGKQVLALGDPDYGTKRDAIASSVYRSGDRGELTPLPGTRAEAKAVGDLVLLGGDASEARLTETLTPHKRWRAVHLACHGLVNAERPQLSSLALTPDKKNDGFLTVLEVFQMKIPADLVVLSACETAKGKVHKAEGIVGFTRSFMLAGAPRVIVSLWKVDDEATKALMVKFYELWKPGKMATATALKKAQEFVRSHKKWEHPYYWAAWQLWGLGD